MSPGRDGSHTRVATSGIIGVPMTIIETDLTGRATDTWQPVRLGEEANFDEKWLQGMLFAHPGALPLDEIDPMASESVSVCRELRPGRGLLDLLLVSPRGRLTLVECKLWRNHG